MVKLASALSLLFVFSGVSAAPTEDAIPDRVALAKRATCTPASLGDTQQDDTPAIITAIKSCGSGGTIVIPAGKTYSLRTMLDFTGCPAIIYFNKITGVKFRSLTGTGVIDGNGQAAYDRWATGSFARPTVIYVVGGSTLSFSGFAIHNPPNAFVGQKGGVKDVTYASLTMTAASKSTNLPKNTDGFDIGESTYTLIQDVVVSNQDDCVAFKSGCNYVTVDGITCSGTNHGLVVGSLGKDNADFVSNVYVTRATMINCGKAAGIKVYPGGSTHGTSTVSNVTWDGVDVQGCDYGAQIQSCYGSDAADCEVNPSLASLSGIYFKNFKGTTNDKQAPAVANLNCSPPMLCDLHFTDWAVKNPSGATVNYCANIDGSPGITCTSGASG
ncbi:hypothetical protein VE03_06147 [Pseudogymnoascus sp. 23342-1-I1]|nr:hypothetical protein VE03_06147 [Pseudogymnoascus sp. 23342-1-I1]